MIHADRIQPQSSGFLAVNFHSLRATWCVTWRSLSLTDCKLTLQPAIYSTRCRYDYRWLLPVHLCLSLMCPTTATDRLSRLWLALVAELAF